MIDTVTLDLREYLLMREKAKAIDEIEQNPNTYLVFRVNRDWNYGISTVFYNTQKDVIDGLISSNKALQEHIDELEEDLKQELSIRKYRLTDKRPWYQFW